MKIHHFYMTLIVLCLLSACASHSTPQAIIHTETSLPPEPTLTQTAIPLPEDRLEAGKIIANLFVQQDFNTIAAYFDATMRQSLPVEQLKLAWVSLAQFGEFQNLGEARSEPYQEYDVVFVTMQFEKSALDLKVVFDQSGQIAGLFFVPVQTAASEPYLPPSYVDPASFTEQEVTIGSGEWKLPGTLTLPKGDGPFPAVVLVHGSGPNDRNESIGPNKPFQDLAWGLASQGVVVLRYDKRTLVHAAKFTPAIIETLTVKEETIDDALLAVALLRQTEKVDPSQIFVLGHSLGGMLIPRIGILDPKIAGLIVMAGPTRPLEDIYLEQVSYLANLDGNLTEDEKKSIAEIEAQIERVKSSDLSALTLVEELPMQIPAAYWLDLRGYAPAEIAKGLSQPMLVLQGERDYQVTTVDFEQWKTSLESRSDVEFILYPGLNHLFIAGEGPGTPTEYEKIGHVEEIVVQDIARWITEQSH